MAVRTTAEAVGLIIEVDETFSLTPFIESANSLVNRIVATAKDADGELFYESDDPDLELIERWLSAHFYAILDPRKVTEGVSTLIDRFQSQVDLNLSVTHYGQQAMVLDTSGALASWNRELAKGPIRRKIGVTWLGLDPSNEEDLG